MIHPLIFLWTLRGFIFSPEYFLIFFSNLYIAKWLQKSFKFMVSRLLENAFASQKIESVHFFLCPQAKISPRFLLLPIQARGNYPLQRFLYFFSAEKERIMKLRKWPKLNLQGYWSQVLINSTIFEIITFLVSVLLYHNMKHTEVWRFLSYSV